jgi:3,4-dihydroxy 2-butanone 4-phosphate synthase/GTP cyclohydrolase II
MALHDLLKRLEGPETTGGARPIVTLCYAQSLDGSITVNRGSPLAISCPESLLLVHELRAAHDAILVGIGTLLADDPRLTVRMVAGEDPQPVVLDSRLRTSPQAVVFKNSHRRPWIMTSMQSDGVRQEMLQAAGARVVRFPSTERGLVDLPAMLVYLKQAGVRHLMVEGGAQVITSFLSERLVDQVVITLAPVMIGGQPAVENLLHYHGQLTPADKDCDNLNCFALLRDVNYKPYGQDLVVFGRLS